MVPWRRGDIEAVGAPPFPVDDEILPKWDPNLANLALDIGKIISSDHDFLKLIETDINRFHQPNPAQVPIGRRQRH